MKTIKVGVMGAGAISRNHCNGITMHKQAELVGIADIHQGRRRAVKKQFGIARQYTNIKDMIADPDIDAVSIALPTHQHAAAAIASLEAGKHVMLDKPFAMNQKEAKAVIAASKKAGKVCLVGMNQRFTEDAQTVKTLIQRGDLGSVYYMRSYWLRRAGAPRFGTWFGQKSKSGGGCLLDIGCHMLDLGLFLLNNFKPEVVMGSTYTKFCNRGLGEGQWGHSDPGKHIFNVDDFAGAMIKLKGGATIQLEVSWAGHQATAENWNGELMGTEGGALVYPATLYRNAKRKGEYEIVRPEDVKLRYPACNRSHNWIDVILKKDRACCTLEQNLVVQKVIDAIYASSKSGKEARVK